MDRSFLVRDLDAALPQTQCTRCGYDDCRAYAEAIADGAPIDRCPPGGDATLAALAALTGLPQVPLDTRCGTHSDLEIAVIDEARCIGCTLCIAACPVDAILGAQKRMHGVLAALCSGCALCVEPCPVDCIDMRPAARAWTHADADAARGRHVARATRLATRGRDAGRRVEAEHAGVGAAGAATAGSAAKRRAVAVAAALERARARRASR